MPGLRNSKRLSSMLIKSVKSKQGVKPKTNSEKAKKVSAMKKFYSSFRKIFKLQLMTLGAFRTLSYFYDGVFCKNN